MKSLVFGIVLIILIGIGGFFYRAVSEQPAGPTACTMEAKVCPDGSSVGRIPPSCEFAACPDASVATDAGFSFTMPAGYSADENGYGADTSVVAALIKPALSGATHTILIRSYAIPEGKTADATILAHTTYEPSDMQATDFSKFHTSLINGKQFRSTVIERFEGQVTSAYFLARANDVLMFEVIESDVDWTNPDLVVEDLPEHQALLTLLASVNEN